MTDAANEARHPEFPAYLQSLNDAQRKAVLCGTGEDGGGPADAPLLVIAGAGSGKTNTLAHRVAHLVARGADPFRILLLTFTTRAAEEMCRRVARILTRLADAGRAAGAVARVSIPWSGTFHSVGARLLREYAGQIGLRRSDEPRATRARLFVQGQALSAEGHVPCDLFDRRQHVRSACRCTAIHAPLVRRVGGGPDAPFPRVRAGQAGQHVLDYDDLLLYWARMVSEPALAREVGGRFSHILVDEYQDTNRLQAAILLAMKPDGRGLTVVGDDAQSIYAFRGATVRNILDFPAQFDPPAQLVTLDRNYRSSAAILEAANALISLACQRYTKDLWTERRSGGKPRIVSVRDDADQAGYVIERGMARREEGIKLRAQAILFRAAHHSTRLELELAHPASPALTAEQ
jgi:DNA helicase-2/ATP-dependent DNA helicase PcrA